MKTWASTLSLVIFLFSGVACSAHTASSSQGSVRQQIKQIKKLASQDGDIDSKDLGYFLSKHRLPNLTVEKRYLVTVDYDESVEQITQGLQVHPHVLEVSKYDLDGLKGTAEVEVLFMRPDRTTSHRRAYDAISRSKDHRLANLWDIMAVEAQGSDLQKDVFLGTMTAISTCFDNILSKGCSVVSNVGHPLIWQREYRSNGLGFSGISTHDTRIEEDEYIVVVSLK